MESFRLVFMLITALLLLALAPGCKDGVRTFQINDLASDPAAFSGQLTVVGIIYGYSQNDATIVGVMDMKELQCTTPNCEKLLLPVKINGTRPAIGDEIKFTGTFSREPEGYLFRAEQVEVLRQHKLGGQG
jgi:hypothetical protein